MPRRRSVFCSECGHYISARATHCPNCNAWTEREKRAWMAVGLKALVFLIVVGVVWGAIRQVGLTLPH
jgi:hypothetical protein